MLRLLTENTAFENPTIPLRWCIDPSDRAKLLKLKATNVHVLIVVAYANGQEDRQLRPLEEAMTYVGFRHPGKHQVFARLVWPDGVGYQATSRFWNDFLDLRRRGFYRSSVLDSAREEMHSDFDHSAGGIGELKPAEPLGVEVDAGHFASAPPQWVQNWVNRWYETDPVDQCAFRRRALVAFTVQVPLMLLWWTLRGIVRTAILAFGLLFLARGMSWGGITSGYLSEVWPQTEVGGVRCRSTWSVLDSKYRLAVWRLLITPAAFIVYGAILQHYHRTLHLSYLMVLMLGVTKLAVLIWKGVLLVAVTITSHWRVSLGVVATVAFLLYAAIRLDYEKTPKYLKELKARQEKETKRLIEESYGYLTCPTADRLPFALTLGALPPNRRTLRLRFYDLKRSVCRPFAG